MWKAPDFVEVIEAAYRVAQPETDWLAGVLAAARPLLGGDAGVWAMTYDLAEASDLRVRAALALGLPAGFTIDDVLSAQRDVPPEAVARTFQTTVCGTASQLLGPAYRDDTSITRFRELGVADTLGLNVRDPTPTGCLLVGILRCRRALGARDVAIWKKVGTHIASGLRLVRERAPAVQGAVAVLTPRGRVEHAEEAAKDPRARERLRAAVLAVEDARGRLRRRSAKEAVDSWKGLVAARWSLLDHFEANGHRYVVARENAPTVGTPPSLTAREAQVLGYATIGHHNKLIAYELGISDTTVRVLFARAARKLGTSGREDTVRVFAAMARAQRGRAFTRRK